MSKKKILAIAIIMFSVVFVQAQNSTEFSFEQLVHDFGKIKEENGKASHSFKFANNGKKPIIIKNVESTCGCTTPEWTRTPILPGKTGFIKVEFDPRQRPGAFAKQVKIFNNITSSPIILEIRGVVIQKTKNLEDIYKYQLGNIRLKSRHLAFARILNTESKNNFVEFVNNGTKPVTLTVNEAALRKHLKVSIEPSKVAPKQRGVIIVTYDASHQPTLWGYNTAVIPILVDGKSVPGYPLSISATVVEDFSKLTQAELANAPTMDFENKTFEFGKIKAGEKVSHDFKFKNNGKRDLIIRKTKTSCGCTAVDVKKIIKPGESSVIKVVFSSRGKRGKQNKRIDIVTNIPGRNKTGAYNSNIVLRIKGEVITE